MKRILPILLIVLSLITPVSRQVNLILFRQNCLGYLKQAADANTAEMALERLTLAIEYVERNGLTYGYTSIMWKTEDENVGYWYQNLKACQNELKLCLGCSQLEKSNVLMKVRESLTDEGKNGTTLTIPKGLFLYPNNGMWCVFVCISLLCFIAGVMWLKFLEDVL